MSAEAELARLEKQVLGIARVSSFRDAVAELRRMLAREDPRVREYVLKLVAPNIGNDLAAAVEAAWNLGITDATKVIGEREPKGLVGRTAPTAIVDAALGATRAVADHIADARKLARAGADPAAVLAKVFAADNTLAREVTSIVNRAGNAGATAVADAVGKPTVWISEVNACVTCLAYSGVVAKPGKAFPTGLTYGKTSTVDEPVDYPPAHPHCLPFDAVVTPGSRVTGASQREYDGDLVVIETLTGNKLTGTPNHPVLTRLGWVALGLIEPGDEVVSYTGSERISRRDDGGEYMPTFIGELAEATLGTFEMSAREVPLTAVDFHGDASDGEVGVIASDRLLRDDVESVLCESCREKLLGIASRRGLPLAGKGGAFKDIFALDTSPDGGVRGLGHSGSLGGRSPGHADGHRGASIADLDPALFESTANDGAGDAEAIRDVGFTLAADIAPDQVVSVERYAFHGMVYNLETERGWYIANGIITHNCRCTVEPLNDQAFADALRRESDRSVLRGFSLASEPMSVRIAAAERLLAKGVVAPKSVKKYAADAVKRGEFTTRGRS